MRVKKRRRRRQASMRREAEARAVTKSHNAQGFGFGFRVSGTGFQRFWFSFWGVLCVDRGTSLIRNCPPPQDPRHRPTVGS